MPEPDQERRRQHNATTAVIVIAVTVIVLGAALILAFLYFRPSVVPDVELKTTAEATQLIEAAGFVVGTTSQLATNAVGPDLVAEQSPAPQSKARRRSAVDLRVAVLPTREAVPPVTGLSASAAIERLTSALFIPQRVDIFDADAPKESVLEQAPGEGVKWMTGSAVAIGVAAGPDDGTGVAVPDIIGAEPQEAGKMLGSVGLLGYGVLADPSQAGDSVVTTQMPSAGVVVRGGTTVLMLLEPK